MSNTTDTAAWTYERNFWAHLDGDFVTVPDQVAADQKAHVGRTFPARAGDGGEVMVTIDAEATGLFTAGTGDLIVRAAPQGWTEIESGAEIDPLFIGVFPCGISYADRTRERHGDYVRLAFLDYATLRLKVEDARLVRAAREMAEAIAAAIKYLDDALLDHMDWDRLAESIQTAHYRLKQAEAAITAPIPMAKPVQR